MRVLVTGATGLIGRHTVELLLRSGYSVRTFQRHPPSPLTHPAPVFPSGRGGKSSSAVEQVSGDVRTDVAKLGEAVRDCAAVVHLAGRGDVAESHQDPLGHAELNAHGTLNAIEAARKAQAMFVLASSQRVYAKQSEACHEDQPPAPDSPYGYTKWLAELWCRMASEQFGVTTRALRFFSVYGPGQQPNSGSGVVTIFARAAINNEPLPVLSAAQRDFTDVRDAARGIALALQKPADGQFRVYNIATGRGTSFRALAQFIIDQTGSSATINERIEEPQGRDLVADITRARTELDYTPCITLKQGLNDYLQWLRKHDSV